MTQIGLVNSRDYFRVIVTLFSRARGQTGCVGFLTILFAVAVAGCGGSSGGRSGQAGDVVRVNVAAAANLRFAFERIEREFEEMNPDIDLQITFGSSANFFAQITQNAPYDVFFSADAEFPRKLIEQRRLSEEQYFHYAGGQIVLWVTNDSSLDLDEAELAILADSSVRRVAIANPRLAPYGVASEESMKHEDVYDRVQAKLVFGDNVAQAAHFVQSGAADIGIVALSLALSPKMKETGRYWIIPNEFHDPISQAGIIIGNGPASEGAERFRAFVTGDEGAALLDEFGYLPPNG